MRWSLAAVLVSLALAGCPKKAPQATDAGENAAPFDAAAASGGHPIARPSDAVAELGILTSRSTAELEAVTTKDAVANALAARHCGPVAACDAVRALVREGENIEVSLATSAEWGLPPASTLGTVAPGLTPKERAGLAALPNVIVIHASGKATPMHLVARAAFAITAALAELVHGFVYDETLRRIETADAFSRHAVTSPLGDAAFAEDRIVVQSYVEDTGTSRLISLGMRRFGAPDLEVRGAQPGAARALGAVLNAVAERLAAGADSAPLAITLSDPTASGMRATVDLVVPPMQKGDPDNAIVRIVPDGGANVAGYDALVTAFFGAAETLVERDDDPALGAARERAARAFPKTVARWKNWPSPRPKLLVKLPFPIGADAGNEWMWVEVTSVDEKKITGTLANSPAYATDLHAGAKVEGLRKDLYDAMLMLPDGGTEGGETSKILERK